MLEPLNRYLTNHGKDITYTITHLDPFQVHQEYPFKIEDRYNGVIGIDPGIIHSGIAYIPNIEFGRHIITVQCDFTGERPTGIHRMLLVKEILRWGLFYANIYAHDSLAVVEGASFQDKFRQVELAEARAAASLYLHERGCCVEYAQPTSVYKKVHGNGRVQSRTVWKDILPPDAASALGCALYGSVE